MLNEEWIADAIDDLCNPMTDSSPADIESSTPVCIQHMVTGEMTVGTINCRLCLLKWINTLVHKYHLM